MFTFPNDFEHAARRVAATMTGNVADMPGRGGMRLVRAGTPEHAQREKDPKVLMIPIEVNGVRYSVCSR